MRRGAIDDRPDLQRRLEGVEDHALALLHADGVELDDGDVAEHVDRQRREAVALGVHKSKSVGFVPGHLARQTDLAPVRERRLDPAPEQGAVDRLVRAGEHPDDDRGFGRIQAATEARAVGIDDRHLPAGDRSAFDARHGLRKHPGMARKDRPHMARL